MNFILEISNMNKVDIDLLPGLINEVSFWHNPNDFAYLLMCQLEHKYSFL
jgi:hypothetical protein